MAFSNCARLLRAIASVLAFLLLFNSTAAFAADAMGEGFDPGAAAAPLDAERVPAADGAPLGNAPAADDAPLEVVPAAGGASPADASAAAGVPPEDALAADETSPADASATDSASPEDAPAFGEVPPEDAPADSLPPEALPRDVVERFADVRAGAWYVEDVQWAFDAGVMTGYDDAGEFGVGDTLTRAQLAALLAKYAGADTSSTVDETGIADKEGAPYVLAVMSSANESCEEELEGLVAHIDAAHDSLLGNL